MVKRLNNKGMTAIEILITFAIVVVIVVSMYNGIADLKAKETVSSYKLSLVTYKNLLTKDIQDDIIKNGLAAATIESMEEAGKKVGYRVALTLRDGTRRILEVRQIFGCAAVDSSEVADLCTARGIDANQSDEFTISYGPEGNLTDYPLPDLGHEEIESFDGSSATRIIYSLQISEVKLSVEDSIFSIHVVLSHPDLESKYSINIVSPINYYQKQYTGNYCLKNSAYQKIFIMYFSIRNDTFCLHMYRYSSKTEKEDNVDTS